MTVNQPAYPITAQDLVTTLGNFAERNAGFHMFENFGHSLAGAGGARIIPEGGYPYRLAQALGARRFRDYSIGGAIACWPTTVNVGDGGYGHVLRWNPRPGVTGAPAAGAPYTPAAQIANVHFGLNDLGVLGSQNPLPFQTAIRTILSHICAGSVFLYNHAAWAYTGAGWTPTGLIDTQASSHDVAGVTYSTSVGATATFTVPADFTANRVVAIGLWLNSAWTANITIGLKVDGVDYPDIVMNAATMCDQGSSSKHIEHTVRIGRGIANDPLLPAGSHTFALTLKSGAALPIDAAWVESDPLDGPLIIAPLPNKPANYSQWSTWTHGPSAGVDPMNDAAVDSWKVSEQAVLNEFPGRVIAFDIDTVGLIRTTDGTGDFISDGAHWTDRGHGKVTQALYDTIVNSTLFTSRFKTRPSVNPRNHWQRVGKFNAAGTFGTGWSNAGTPYADCSWRRNEDGRVFIRGGAKAASGATTTLLPANTLPKPDTVHDFVGQQYNGTTWTEVAMRVHTDGSLLLLNPVVTTAGNVLSFDASYDREVS